MVRMVTMLSATMVTMRYPSGLGKAGRALWRSVLADYELSAAELAVLRRACVTADYLDRIDAALSEGLTAEGSLGQPRPHPLMRALYEQSVLFAQLLRELALPMPDEESGQRRSPAAVAAAQARWRAQVG